MSRDTDEQQLRETLERAYIELKELREFADQVSDMPLIPGTVIQIQEQPSLDKRFKKGTEFKVVAKDSRYYDMTGTIKKVWGDEATVEMSNGDPADIQLDSGRIVPLKEPTRLVLVSTGGSISTARYPAKFDVRVGELVLVHPMTRQIVDKSDFVRHGAVTRVAEVTEKGLVIADMGAGRVSLFNPFGKLKVGDRIETDGISILSVLPPEKTMNNKPTVNVAWSQVGGLAVAKRELHELADEIIAVKKVKSAFPIKPIKGVFLHGTPGNGKTLLAKAFATQLGGGFFPVKGPELLSHFVGDTEASIRQVFAQAELYHKETGRPGVIFFDEADALFPQRGKSVSTDVFNTIVPTFLTCQDGLETSSTVVILASNRPELIDAAVTRDGRVDRQFEIGQPTIDDATEILTIHIAGAPVETEIVKPTVEYIYSEKLPLYLMNGNHPVYLRDIISGAMLAGVAQRAMRHAVSESKKKLSIEDLKFGVDQTYQQERGMNHDVYLVKCAERAGMEIKSVVRAK